MEAPPVRVLGLDPGSQRTGYGLVQAGPRGRAVFVAAGVISAPAGLAPPWRLQKIHQELCQVIARQRPLEMAVEGVFAAQNARTAIMLGQARGVALLAAAQAGLEVFEYPPAAVKKALTGAGRADKEQVQRMVRVVLGVEEPLGLDASDALAIAICHLQGRALRREGMR